MKYPEQDHVDDPVRNPNSGFGSDRKREQYRELDADGRPIPVPEQPEPPQKKPIGRENDTKKRSRLPVLIAAACVLILGLSIWIGTGLYRPWEKNILRNDAIEDLNGDGDTDQEDAYISPVFGSAYRREQISSITVLDTLKDVPAHAWDVSEANDGTVMAWLTPNGELYDLYLAGKGGISAGSNASWLFAGYKNVSSITFGDAFHTAETETMRRMFYHCHSLKELDISNFKTSNVTDMNYMFYCCDALEKLTLGDPDTSNVKSMKSMFCYCTKLGSLDISNFETSNVTDMRYMFYDCENLTEETLIRGENFVTDNADTTEMLFGIGEPKPWKGNVLRNFKRNDVNDDGKISVEEAGKSSVFNLPYLREQIHSITILDTLADAPEDAADVSESANGSVLAWVTPHDDLYDLYIAGEGGISAGKYPNFMFAGYVNAVSIDLGSAFHTDDAEEMFNLFYGCRSVDTLVVNNFKTSNVTTMRSMFSRCENLTTLDISGFDIAKVTNMSWMFNGCTKLTNLTLGENFIVAADVEANHMFDDCPADHRLWQSNVLKFYPTNDADGNKEITVEEQRAASVFGSDYRREQIRSVTILDTLKDAPDDAWDVSESGNRTVMAWVKPNGDLYDLYIAGYSGVCTGKNVKYLFSGYANVESFEPGQAFHTEGTENMLAMFYGCTKLEKLVLTDFDTSAVTNMSWMFAKCPELTKLEINEDFVPADAETEYMFYNCPAMDDLWKSNVLKYYTVLDTDGNGDLTVEEFAASAVFGSSYRREQISSITVLDTLKDAPEDAWDVSDDGSGNVMAWVRQNGEMFDLYLAGEGGICIEGNTLFLFAGYTNAVSINLGEAFHTEGAQSMYAMFYDCKELVELHLSGFATSNVTDMRWMFAKCTKLKNLTLGDSFIVGDNTDTEYMFSNCPAGENYAHLVN